MERGKWIVLVWWFLFVPIIGISQPAERACFSVPGGFYDNSFSLEITPFYQNHHIRYTTNGNRPTAASQLYTGPLLLDESLYSTSDIYTIQISPDNLVYVPDSVRHCIVIRAAVFDQNENCISEVSTNSYFIHALGCDTHGMPVVSLCADSLDLFDYEHGIFVPGVHFDPLDPNCTGNYYQKGDDWERSSNVEFYELDNQGVNQQAGLRTHGGSGRRFQQKCVKLYARDIYGKNRFEHRFFEDLPIESFKHLVLKPFAASWSQTGASDHLCNQIAAQLNLETLASRPVVTYLNGEYWGIYYIHERPDERYLEDHFGVDINHVNVICGWFPIEDHGTMAHFVELFHWFETADLSSPEDYAYAISKIDVESFIDFQIFELFSENVDWPANNMRCWQEGDGRWRWFFYDGDACLRWLTYNAFENAIYEGDGTWPSSKKSTLFFRKLLENNIFSSQFYDRFLELQNTAFDYSVTGPWYSAIKATLEPEIPFQSHRFAYPSDVESWNADMGHLKWFLMKRCESMAPVLEEFLKNWSTAESQLLSLEVFPNPSNGPVTLHIQAEHPETLPITVFDMMGRQVVAQTINADAGYNTYSIELPPSPGLYVVKLDTMVVKIIRQ